MSKPRWYVVHVYSGAEKKVAETILEQAEKKGLNERILQALVPTEEIVEVKKGTKVTSERNFFPGYILVQIEMADDTWHRGNSTQKVTGFLGSKGRPSVVSEREVARILSQVEEQHEKARSALIFEIGEQVKVCDGPFNSFTGLVEDVDPEKERLKDSVSIFGRPTPVDHEYSQVEKT
jgi:transcriptional antiterminator NusG